MVTGKGVEGCTGGPEAECPAGPHDTVDNVEVP